MKRFASRTGRTDRTPGVLVVLLHIPSCRCRLGDGYDLFFALSKRKEVSLHTLHPSVVPRMTNLYAADQRSVVEMSSL